MHSAILRALVFLAAAGVIGAATHANVVHAGGYGSRDAALIITLAVLLALGMAFVGVCFNEGRHWQAILLAVLILAGEAYWVLINADREVANLDAASAPVAEHARGPCCCCFTVEKAETAKRPPTQPLSPKPPRKIAHPTAPSCCSAGQQQAARESECRSGGPGTIARASIDDAAV